MSSVGSLLSLLLPNDAGGTRLFKDKKSEKKTDLPHWKLCRHLDGLLRKSLHLEKVTRWFAPCGSLFLVELCSGEADQHSLVGLPD